MAHGLHVAAELGAADGGFMYDRIEDGIVQADEVDGKYLQFEGGLSITGKFCFFIYLLKIYKTPMLVIRLKLLFLAKFVLIVRRYHLRQFILI